MSPFHLELASLSSWAGLGARLTTSIGEKIHSRRSSAGNYA